MTDLLELAARVEGLTGPDREVDALIWLHLPEQAGHAWKHNGDKEAHARQIAGVSFVPRYTASIGPAMSLLPDDWDHMEVYRPDYQTLGWTVHVMYNANIDRGQITGFAQSHELALVAACLRARAHGGGEG